MLLRKRRSNQPNQRWGAAAVETAFVMIPMTMLLFCIFEYCRFFMIWNLVKNAAREGCRYALVNNTSPTLTADVTTPDRYRQVGGTKRNLERFDRERERDASGCEHDCQ